MSITKEQAMDELKRRGVEPIPPPAVTKEQAASELKKRGAISKTRARDLPMIGDYPELNKFFFTIPGVTQKGTLGEIGKSLATSFLVSVSSDEESADILTSQYPGSKVIRDDEGGTIFVDPQGNEYALDVPGVDIQDIARGATEILGFAIKPGMTVAGAAGQAAVKQTGIEAAQEAAGGEFEPGTIGAATVGAGAGQYLGELIGRGTVALREGADDIIRQGEELGAPILTSDIVEPEAGSALVRFITRAADKYPGIGAAAARAEQRRARNQIAENLVREFDLTDDLAKHPTLAAEALDQVHVENVARAVQMRQDAFKSIKEGSEKIGVKVPINKTLQNLKGQISELERLGAKSDIPIINNLQDALETLPKATNFDELAFIRTRIIRMMKESERGTNPAFPSESYGRLAQAKAVLDKEMQAYASKASPKAGKQWKESNKLFADEYSAYDRTILAKIANEGEYAADKLQKTLAQTDVKNLKQLYAQMDEAGKIHSKATIMQDILEKSDYFKGEFSAAKLARQLDKSNVKVFFHGDEKKQLEGLSRFIRATAPAQAAKEFTPTGWGVWAEMAMGAPVAAIGRLYQSQAMRNLLLALSKTNPKSPQGQGLIQNIRRHVDRVSDEITAAGAVTAPEAMKEVLE